MSLIFAHRGASHSAPENTMLAFQASIDEHADGVELDVQLTRDGELVVIHDETVDRVSDTRGWVRDFTLEELQNINVAFARPRYSAATSGSEGGKATIPTLREVLELMKQANMLVNIEFKTSIINYEDSQSGNYTDNMPGKIVEKTLALVEDLDIDRNIIYSSFNHQTLLALRTLHPKAQFAPLFDEVMLQPWEYAKALQAQGIHPDYHTLMLYPQYIDACHRYHQEIRAWTVDDPSDIAWLGKHGVDVLITNEPTLAREALA